MAGDWIKMRTDLYRDPKVSVMADDLMREDGALARYVNQFCQRDMSVTRNAMRNAVVGALVSVWGVMRQRGKRNGDDLVMLGVTADVLDDIADMPGFGHAMERVGWAKETEEGIEFPRFFEEHNADPAERKAASAAERQRRYRERQKSQKRDATGDVTRDATVTHREEERREEKREEKNTTSAKADHAQVGRRFEQLWQAWPPGYEKGVKKRAAEAFAKLNPAPELFDQMLAALAAQAREKALKRSMGQFVSEFQHVERWIRNQRWTDEIESDNAIRNRGPGRDGRPHGDRTAQAAALAFGNDPGEAPVLDGDFHRVDEDADAHRADGRRAGGDLPYMG